VEVTRSEYQRLREQLGLKAGSTVHLKPRRVTRFEEAARA
jgi:sulfate/thiosulfate transport system ATP-binding protein